MPACAPVACKTSKVLLENDVISVSSHEVEPTTAAEVAPSLAPSLAEVQRPEAAVAITILVIPGARWVGGGLPDGGTSNSSGLLCHAAMHGFACLVCC